MQKKRMFKRKLLIEWIAETVKSPDILRRKGKKFYSVKKINGFTLKIVYVKERYLKIVKCYFVK